MIGEQGPEPYHRPEGTAPEPSPYTDDERWKAELCKCYHAPEEHDDYSCRIYGCSCEAHWLTPKGLQ